MQDMEPETICEAVANGAELLEGGVTDYARWSRAMCYKFGELIRPHLELIWIAAREERQRQQVVPQQLDDNDSICITSEGVASAPAPVRSENPASPEPLVEGKRIGGGWRGLFLHWQLSGHALLTPVTRKPGKVSRRILKNSPVGIGVGCVCVLVGRVGDLPTLHGWRICEKSPRAVKMAKRGLILIGVLGAASALCVPAIVGTAVLARDALSGCVGEALKALIFPAFWYAYLRRSRRVKETYGLEASSIKTADSLGQANSHEPSRQRQEPVLAERREIGGWLAWLICALVLIGPCFAYASWRVWKRTPASRTYTPTKGSRTRHWRLVFIRGC